MTKGLIASQPLTWEETQKIIASKLVEHKITDGEDINLCVRAARVFMDNPPPDLDKILGTEEHLALKYVDGKLVECDWKDPDCYVRCKIDILQIDGNVATVIDHKTQQYIETADTFQMGFYAWMVKKFYPYVSEVKTILHFCHPDINYYSKPVSWFDEELKIVETEIHVRIEAIESITEHEAVPNYHCNYCSLVLQCPKVQELNTKRTQYGVVRNGPLIDATEAQAIAGILTVVDQGRKVLNEKLQKFVKEIGSVDIQGKRYSYEVSEKKELPDSNKQALWEVLEKYGLNPMDFMDFDLSKIQALWKTGAKKSFFEDVEQLLHTTKNTKFGGRKL